MANLVLSIGLYSYARIFVGLGFFYGNKKILKIYRFI